MSHYVPIVPTPSAPSWLQMPGSFSITAGMRFDQAADLWMQSRSIGARQGTRSARFIRPTTEESYRQYVASLKMFFGTLRLCDIRLDHIRAYQEARVTGAAPFIRKRRPHEEAAPCPAKPKKANQELGILKQILKRAKLWSEDHDLYYEPMLEIESDMQRALSEEEQARWLGISQSEARWHIVHWYSVLAFATCMSTNEIRSLRLGDISLESRVLTVPVEGSKNRYRNRTIAIDGPQVQWAVKWLVDRAHRLGAFQPQDYLFPARVGPGRWKPEAPMGESGIKKRWEEVRKASNLTWFRQYDCRHTAITRYAEAGTPIGIIMDLAGHISPKMTKHYTHISDAMKSKAMRSVQQRSQSVASGTPYRWPEASGVESQPVNASDAIAQAIRVLQEQCGLTAEQLRQAILAAPAAAANVVEFRPR